LGGGAGVGANVFIGEGEKVYSRDCTKGSKLRPRPPVVN